MSRLFQFLEKLNLDVPEQMRPDAPVRDRTKDVAAREILSILDEVQDVDPPQRDERMWQLRHVEVKEVALNPQLRLICQTEPKSAATDRFRYLRMRLRLLRKERDLRCILITSPLPHEGKSTMALNLATILAERGERTVLLIDADLHHFGLSQRLGLEGADGLTDCLSSSLNPLVPMRRLEPLGWYFLPAGERRKKISELLHGEAIAAVLQKASLYFDWIVIDSPPVLSISDAVSLAQHTDGSLIVARAGCTPSQAIENTVKLLGRKHVVGLILNGEERSKYQQQSGALAYTTT